MKADLPKINKPLVYSIGISVLLHLVVIGGTSPFKVASSIKTDKKKPRFVRVKVDKVKIPMKVGGTREEAKEEPKKDPVVPIRFENPKERSGKTFAQAEQKKMKKSEHKTKDKKFKSISFLRRDVLDEIKDYDKETSVLKSTSQRSTQQDYRVTVSKPSEALITRPEDVSGTHVVSEDFVDKMPGYTPKLTEKSFNPWTQKVLAKLGRGHSTIVERKMDPEDIDELLMYKLANYIDPETGEKYYRISISVEALESELSTIPKEIVFLVDCSISIDEKRLQQFKEGLQYSLTHLNSDDYFNILAFKERIIKFKDVSVKKDETTVKEALDFIDTLTIGEKTDTYNALYKSLTTENPTQTSYIILLSDGRPTKGITNPRELINKISDLNDGHTSIFAFSGGIHVNRYLLDFISYKNRGWAEYSHRTHFIGKNLSNLYKKIRDPVMLNLRYHITAFDNEEIFPKMLPDFFRNAEFTLYGKYSDQNKFVMQLLGDIKGKTKEFIIESAMDKAYQGDEEIARNWAFNKIYYLIGKLEHNQDNTAIINEINGLSKQFGIRTPYLQDILK